VPGEINQYFCYLDISARGDQSIFLLFGFLVPGEISSQCFGTHMVYKICLLLKSTVPR
jgi:hypothetical protein